jgi:hypothetical protein
MYLAGEISLTRKGENKMKNLRIVVAVCVLALLGMLASRVVAQKPLLPKEVAVAATAVSQDALSPQEIDAVADTVGSYISYQGRLSDPDSGTPLNGTYDLEFSFWTLSSGGAVLDAILRDAQTIENGLYSTRLPITASNFDGRELWLRIRVRETGSGSWETLEPRIEVLPTAYALGLRPEARISGSTDRPNAIVMATNTSSGWGLRGESTEYTGYGVYGYNGSTSPSAYGGGVIGVTETDGYGVRGEAPSSGDFCYGGYFIGRTGVRGYGAGDNYLYDYGGYFIAQRRGLYASSLSGWYAAYFNGDIYVGGIIYPDAPQTVVVNDGDETLEAGDVVAIAGIAEFPGSTNPVLAVRKTNGAADIAVVGVVGQAMRVQEVDPLDGDPREEMVDVQPVEGDIPPGAYLAIVSHGLAPAVKVAVPPTARADNELRVGELLSLGAVPGTVQKAEAQLVDGRSVYAEGTILGKVAGPFDPQTGTVPVFVTLQ